MNDFEKDLVIDRNALDEAWENQALLFCKWAEREVNALDERDRAKENVDLVRSEVDTDIRKNVGDKKPTENAIASTIQQDNRYKSAMDNYLTKVHDAKILSVAREAFDHRKTALVKLTDLFLAQYNAEPRESSFAKKVIEEKSREQHYDNLNRSMGKRKRV